MNQLFGMQVVVSKNATEKRWVFPQDRFVEYEPKDESWCRLLEIGHEEEKPAAYRVGETLMVHPDVWDQIVKETGLAQKNVFEKRAEKMTNELNFLNNDHICTTAAKATTAPITRDTLEEVRKLLKTQPRRPNPMSFMSMSEMTFMEPPTIPSDWELLLKRPLMPPSLLKEQK